MGNQNMRTPRWLFDYLNERFGPFQLDAFASPENALCTNYWTEQDNGLEKPWACDTFANPPFRLAGAAIEKAYDEFLVHNNWSVLILPVGCSQQWYHRYCLRDSRITVYHPDCRINFDMSDGTPTKSADRDTMIVCVGKGSMWGSVFPLCLKEHRKSG